MMKLQHFTIQQYVKANNNKKFYAFPLPALVHYYVNLCLKVQPLFKMEKLTHSDPGSSLYFRD